MPIPLDLTLSQSLWASALGALFTAVFVTFGAGVLVKWVETREARRRLDAENKRADEIKQADRERADALRKADEERADALLEAEQLRADALREAEIKRADLQRELDEKHDQRQQRRDHELQTRSALRESYGRLLVAQRQSRQASLTLAGADAKSRDTAELSAKGAHDEFIDEYHRLALDADRGMWLELRGLRNVLDDMLELAQTGAALECEALTKTARNARQNLERSFRLRLGHEPLQPRRSLDKYDKN